MNKIDFNKPKKIKTTEDHNSSYSSDCGVDGTYVPNMSEEDTLKWKGKVIKKGNDPRIEIRKVFKFEKNFRTFGAIYTYCNVVIIVRPESCENKPHILISTNSKIGMTYDQYDEMNEVIDEAKIILKNL